MNNKPLYVLWGDFTNPDTIKVIEYFMERNAFSIPNAPPLFLPEVKLFGYSTNRINDFSFGLGLIGRNY